MDFVNSVDLRPFKEELETPKQPAAWLAGRGLLAPGARVTRTDLEETHRVREALRDVLSAKSGIEVDVRSSSGQVWPLRLTRRPDGSLHVQLDNAD